MSGTEIIEDSRSQLGTENQSAMNQEADLVCMLIVVAKKKRMILWTTILATFAAVLYSLHLPNQYTAETKLLAPQQRESMASLLLGPLSTLGGLGGNVRGLSASAFGLTDPNGMYISILESRSMADRLVDRFDLQSVYQKRLREDARMALAHASDIASSKDGGITIRVTDVDRNRAATLANAYVEEFRKITDQLALTEAAQRRKYFESELNKTKDQLAQAEGALKSSQERTGMLELDAQSKSIIQATVALKSQIAAKEVQVQSMSSFAAPQNPDFILAKNQLAALRSQLSKLEKGSSSGNGDILIPTGNIPEAGLEYSNRLRDVKYYEQIFKVLAGQYEAAKADEGRSAVILQVLDVATPPERRSKPHRAFIVLFVAILSFGGSVLVAFAMESAEQFRSDSRRREQIRILKLLLLPKHIRLNSSRTTGN
jgi:tyrosine-protein kinase Etk/Wzc